MKKVLLILCITLPGIICWGQVNSRPVTINPRSGYVTVNELTGGYGMGQTTLDYSKYYFGFTTTHGYQLNIYGLHVNSSIVGGIGTGILFYNGGQLFPLYGDVRFRLNRGKISPFLFARGGFLVSIKDFNEQTRSFVNGGGGINIKLDERISFSIGPGLLVQMGSNVSRDTFITLNAGIVFKPN